MTALSGYVLSAATSTDGDPLLSTDIDSFPYFLYFPHSTDGFPAVRGFTTLNLPDPKQRQAKIGHYNASHFDDYWLRIHHVPTSIDVGNLLSQQTRKLSIWNSFLVDVEVQGIDVSGFDGIRLAPPALHPGTPYVLEPNEETTYEVVVDLSGPPLINGQIIFHTNHGDILIEVKGSRVVLFPFSPNWASQPTETLSARSSAIRSYGGNDQTVSTRNKVRRAFSYPYSVHGLNAQLFSNLIAGWQFRLYGLPIWPESSYSTADTLEADVVIQVSTLYRSFQVGGLVMICNGKDPNHFEVREIESLNDTSITVTVPLDLSWRQGSKVLPVLLAQMDEQVSGTRLTGSAILAQIGFECEPSTSSDNVDEDQTVALYRNYEVYLGRTNWRDPNAFNFNTDVTRIDMQGGVFELRMRSDFSPEGRSHDWFLKNLQAVRQFRNWISRRKGKAIGCWMPSSYDDFTLSLDYVANTNGMTVVDNGYATYIKENEARRDIFILLRDGTHYQRRIADATLNTNGTITLVLDTPIPVAISKPNVRQFSYLQFYRMSADDTTITWQTEGVAEAVTGLLPTKAPA